MKYHTFRMSYNKLRNVKNQIVYVLLPSNNYTFF